MKNEEKKPVGSLLGQKVLEDEDTGLEKTVGCVGMILAFFLFILLFIILITKWSFVDWFM